MAERIPQATTKRVPLQAYLGSDHLSPATGKTLAVTISKNGAAYGNPSGGATNAVEIGSGSYYVDLTTTDTGTLGPLFVLGTAAGVDNIVAIYTVDYANQDKAARAVVRGVCGAGSSSTSVTTSSLSPACVDTDQFKGRVIIFDADTVTAGLRGQGSSITTNSSGGVFTVPALSEVPSSGDTFGVY